MGKQTDEKQKIRISFAENWEFGFRSLGFDLHG